MRKETKVLCLCSKGRNRSSYLADYLRRKGYSTRFGGIESWEDSRGPGKPFTQDDVDWADVIIIVRRRLAGIFKKNYNFKGKRIIILDVSDSKRLVPDESAHLRDLSYLDFQKKWTRPLLRKALKKHMPLNREEKNE